MGQAFAHRIGNTEEGLSWPHLAYCLCLQRFLGINTYTCSLSRVTVKWKQLTMEFTAVYDTCYKGPGDVV